MTVKLAHLTTVDLSLRYLVLAQMTEAERLGWDSIGISAPGPYVAEIEQVGIRHLPLPTSSRGWDPLADVRAAVDLWRILRRERVDILHTHNPKPGLYGRIVGRLAGIPIVVNTVHGLYAGADDRLLKRLVVYLAEAVASRFSDAELMQNVEDLELTNRYHITRRHRTALLGNGVDLVRFDPDRFDEAERRLVREELGVADDQILVGTVGRLVAEKGYPELVAAAAGLPDRYTAVAIGPDDPEKPDALGTEFAATAAAAGVRLLGMRTDVDRLYVAMDLFVLASHREGFPRAAMEAAAMGLPVVASDIRGCRQVVDHGGNGLLVPVGDAIALAGAITTIGEDPVTRKAMGEASHRKARTEFDESRVVRTVFSTYHAVAKRKGIAAVVAAAPESLAPVIRPATLADVPHLARLHIEAIATGFLPSLGSGVMERLYTALLAWDDAVVLVADGGWRPVGFVAGVTDTGAFYRHFLRRHGAGAGIAAAPRLVRPSVLRRAWETVRYGGGGDGVAAELLSMAVDDGMRRRGLGKILGEDFLTAMTTRGVTAVRVVVGSGNHGAIAAYRAMGFSPSSTIEVHGGESSQVLTWSPR
ncbi:MAG: GNAT family N-acetyltransferase [Actinomycetota bacterium]|nr:GNAT family N-acetyltransferase [Actinomycetota bacterium]